MHGSHFRQRLMKRRFITLMALLCWPLPAQAQRLASVGLATGLHVSDDTEPTAAFSGSLTVEYRLHWLVTLQRTVAEYARNTGTQRSLSIAVTPIWEPWGGRAFIGAGATLHGVRVDRTNGVHEQSNYIGLSAVAGMRAYVAGPGLSLELSGRGDALNGQRQLSALFGMRYRPQLPNTLTRGEPSDKPVPTLVASAWQDVLMQLILLQQNLETFTRIREIETGIELEFESGRVTLYDDIAKVARVLAATDPPVNVTVFAPNAGRVGAAVTAGSFPPERLRLEQNSRVFLRVER